MCAHTQGRQNGGAIEWSSSWEEKDENEAVPPDQVAGLLQEYDS